MVFGWKTKEERMVAKGDMSEIEEAVLQNESEVNSSNKFFELYTPRGEFAFFTHKGFRELRCFQV